MHSRAAHVGVDIGARAERDGDALVQRAGLDLEGSLRTARAAAASLLHEEGDGRRLEQEPQLAPRPPRARRVEEDAAVQERAVHVGDKGAGVTQRFALRDQVDVQGHRLAPLAPVAEVDRVEAAGVRHPKLRPRQREAPERGVEGEAVDAPPDGEHELRGGAEHNVPRSEHLLAPPEHGGGRPALLAARARRVDTEDGPRRRARVRLLRVAPERVHHHRKAPHARACRRGRWCTVVVVRVC
mmetsp:Transcript_28489/g.94636  ORF Transcript_28489/g.94636 Transcript_28489/m.94636 type:complete len:241 (+) Transcript_28489:131-853(+)